mmetsp:Transcript_23721/g.74660  ORF Transcript_23721/g.74660 Transcript_23721/m.74660 type:complete len:242 (+) Transcript_23721:753-1478(+)
MLRNSEARLKPSTSTVQASSVRVSMRTSREAGPLSPEVLSRTKRKEPPAKVWLWLFSAWKRARRPKPSATPASELLPATSTTSGWPKRQKKTAVALCRKRPSPASVGPFLSTDTPRGRRTLSSTSPVAAATRSKRWGWEVKPRTCSSPPAAKSRHSGTSSSPSSATGEESCVQGSTREKEAAWPLESKLVTTSSPLACSTEVMATGPGVSATSPCSPVRGSTHRIFLPLEARIRPRAKAVV